MFKNKRGWIRIVEAFVAVLLITGVVLVLINRGYFGEKDDANTIYDIEVGILRDIESDAGLRDRILSIPNANIPTEESNPIFPIEIRNKIDSRIPAYLECRAKICWAERVCPLVLETDKDVYAQTVIIAANLETYDPRQVKIFCWRK